MTRLEGEFKKLIGRISSVNFEFVNGEPEAELRSGRSVPIILGTAWKVFKASRKSTADFYIVKTYDKSNELVDKVYTNIDDAEKMKAARDSTFGLRTEIIPVCAIDL